MSIKEYQALYNNYRLDMHCISKPKDYTKMTADNWKCYCKSCHGKLENINLIKEI